MSAELPQITKSMHSHATYDGGNLIMGHAMAGAQGLVLPEMERHFGDTNDLQRRLKQALQPEQQRPWDAAQPQRYHPQPKEKPMPSARIVRVFIADTNENIPLEKRIIYKSEEKLTDLTDQELFFEANPAALLADHNALRTTVIDKALTAARGKEVFLEPARIRDLKMVVVDVAAF